MYVETMTNREREAEYHADFDRQVWDTLRRRAKSMKGDKMTVRVTTKCKNRYCCVVRKESENAWIMDNYAEVPVEKSWGLFSTYVKSQYNMVGNDGINNLLIRPHAISRYRERKGVTGNHDRLVEEIVSGMAFNIKTSIFRNPDPKNKLYHGKESYVYMHQDGAFLGVMDGDDMILNTFITSDMFYKGQQEEFITNWLEDLSASSLYICQAEELHRVRFIK